MNNLQLSNEKSPGCLGYIRDCATQSCGDHFINHKIRIPIEQPAFNGKYPRFFFRGSIVLTVILSPSKFPIQIYPPLRILTLEMWKILRARTFAIEVRSPPSIGGSNDSPGSWSQLPSLCQNMACHLVSKSRQKNQDLGISPSILHIIKMVVSNIS